MGKKASLFHARKAYVFTGFPEKMVAITPDDNTDFAVPGTVRANAAGAVTFIPAGNEDNETITLNLVAGEYIPCLVRRVLDTGTDAIVLHLSYQERPSE